MCLSVPHRNDKATKLKQQATLHGLKKHNWDVVIFTESDRKELSGKIRGKKCSMQNDNKKENKRRTVFPEQLLNTKAGKIQPVKR